MSWDPFDELSDRQHEQLDAYEELLLHFNAKINLISREDEDRVRWHIRHCLMLAFRSFPEDSVVVDWGTGGGLPAIPLAIRFPAVQFHAVDSVRKKVRAVRTMARRLGLGNVEEHHARAESWTRPHHYSVSRATAPLSDLWTWHLQAVESFDDVDTSVNWAPGMYCLKGGDIDDDIRGLYGETNAVSVTRISLREITDDVTMADKYMLYTSAHKGYST